MYLSAFHVCLACQDVNNSAGTKVLWGWVGRKGVAKLVTHQRADARTPYTETFTLSCNRGLNCTCGYGMLVTSALMSPEGAAMSRVISYCIPAGDAGLLCGVAQAERGMCRCGVCGCNLQVYSAARWKQGNLSHVRVRNIPLHSSQALCPHSLSWGRWRFVPLYVQP